MPRPTPHRKRPKDEYDAPWYVDAALVIVAIIIVVLGALVINSIIQNV